MLSASPAPAARPGRGRGRLAVVGAAAAVVGLSLGRFAFLDATTSPPVPAVAPAAVTAEARIAGLEARVAARPDDLRAWQQLGSAYVSRAAETGDPAFFDLAARTVRRAEALRPGDPATRLVRATLALGLHDFRRALRLGRRAVAADPYDAAALGVVVDAEVELGHYRRAAVHLERMLALDPGLPALARVAYLRELHGDLGGAVRALQQAEVAGAATPTAAAPVATLLGDVHRRRGDLDAAEDAYGRALQRRPALPAAQVGQARVLAARGDRDGAVRLLRRVTARFPQPGALMLLADLLTLQRRHAEARDAAALVDAGIRLASAAGQDTDLDAAIWLADQGRHRAALAAARRVYRARPGNVYAADALAWALHRRGDHAAALPLADRAVRLGSADPALHHHAAEVFAAAGRTGAAAAALRRALRGDLPPRQAAAAAILARRLDVVVPQGRS